MKKTLTLIVGLLIMVSLSSCTNSSNQSSSSQSDCERDGLFATTVEAVEALNKNSHLGEVSLLQVSITTGPYDYGNPEIIYLYDDSAEASLEGVYNAYLLLHRFFNRNISIGCFNGVLSKERLPFSMYPSLR